MLCIYNAFTHMILMCVPRATSNKWREYLFCLATVIKEGLTFGKDRVRALHIGQGFE